MATKFSQQEPAARPYTVALSGSEVVALANWHVSIARAIPKRLGKAQMELQAKSILGSPRQMQGLLAAAREQLDAHSKRTHDLMAIVKA